jgi:hypothetical protein
MYMFLYCHRSWAPQQHYQQSIIHVGYDCYWCHRGSSHFIRSCVDCILLLQERQQSAALRVEGEEPAHTFKNPFPSCMMPSLLFTDWASTDLKWAAAWNQHVTSWFTKSSACRTRTCTYIWWGWGCSKNGDKPSSVTETHYPTSYVPWIIEMTRTHKLMVSCPNETQYNVKISHWSLKALFLLHPVFKLL